MSVARISASRSSSLSAVRKSSCMAVGASSDRQAAHSAWAPTRTAAVYSSLPTRYACLESFVRFPDFEVAM